MTDMTKEEIAALLGCAAPGIYEIAPGANSHVFEFRIMAGEACVGFSDEDNANFFAAAPDLARTALSALQRADDAEAAQALMLKEAAVIAKRCVYQYADPEPPIMALAPATGKAALAALRELLEAIRAQRDKAVGLAEGFEAERDTLAASLAAAQAEVTALREAWADWHKAQSDRSVVAVCGPASAAEYQRLSNLMNSAEDVFRPLAAHDSRNDKEGG